MIDLFSYVFSPVPGTSFSYDIYLYIFAAILIVIGFVFMFLLKKNKDDRAFKKTFVSTPSQFIWIGFVLLIVIASRTNGIPYLSMRFLQFITLGLGGYYIVKSIIGFVKTYPNYKKELTTKRSVKEDKKYSTSKK